MHLTLLHLAGLGGDFRASAAADWIRSNGLLLSGLDLLAGNGSRQLGGARLCKTGRLPMGVFVGGLRVFGEKGGGILDSALSLLLVEGQPC